MGRHWSGFMAQNELAKLHWAVLEQCQMSGPEKDFTMFSLAGLQEQQRRPEDGRRKGKGERPRRARNAKRRPGKEGGARSVSAERRAGEDGGLDKCSWALRSQLDTWLRHSKVD